MNFRVSGVLCIAIFCLLSCTSSPTRQAKKTTIKQPKAVILDEVRSEDLLAQARSTDDTLQRNSLLLQTAEALQSEQKCVQSIKLLKVLQPELDNNRQITQSQIILAECYLKVSDNAFENVASILSSITFPYDFQGRIVDLQVAVEVNKKQWLNAATALQNSDLEDIQKAATTWQWISKLSLPELQQASLTNNKLQPVLQLAIIVKRFGLKPKQFQQQIVRWQGRNLSHPLATQLPEEIQISLSQAPIQGKRIAVLLPLTGRLSNQGLAIKEGILAAYLTQLQQANEAPNSSVATDELTNQIIDLLPQELTEIRFFDSALKTASELNELVSDFDVILGPLVKEQIEELTKILPADKILLALNRVSFKPNPPLELVSEELSNNDSEVIANVESERYYFSLAPEDEAQQLATLIHNKHLVRPIIFAADDPITQRMAAAFISKWNQTPNAIEPDLTLFSDSKDMRTSVSQMLDVAQSNQRIKQMEYMSDVEVIGVERNRRDIDAIVLFANPEQTKLLNPIIEASLSPFAKQSLSVFASSRSYSLDLNSNNLRDLRNLTFTDMPWMLPNHNWQDLTSQTKKLWPQRQDTLLRLFAMGFDAYNLLTDLRQLKTLPQVVSQGLTGAINVNNQGVIGRQLPWAQVTEERVTLLENN